MGKCSQQDFNKFQSLQIGAGDSFQKCFSYSSDGSGKMSINTGCYASAMGKLGITPACAKAYPDYLSCSLQKSQDNEACDMNCYCNGCGMKDIFTKSMGNPCPSAQQSFVSV